MKLLLDTHVVLWWYEGNKKLARHARHLLETEHRVYVSPATIWEITIKQALSKIDAPSELAEMVAEGEFEELPVRHRHTLTAGRLPLIHNDPFDRLLVAQAQCEQLTLVTADDVIPRYNVPCLRPH